MYRQLYGKGSSVEGKGKGGAGVVAGKGKGGDWCGVGAKGKGGGGSSSGSGGLILPKGLKNKAKYSKTSKTRPGSAPAASTDTIVYGGRRNKDGAARYKTFLHYIFPEVAGAIDKNEAEEDEDEEKCRISEEEMAKLEELVVVKVTFHNQGKKKQDGQCKKPGNAKKHHTDKYCCCTCQDKCTCQKKKKLPILRRGQEFKITVTFKRPFNGDHDDLFLIVDPDTENTGKNMSKSFKLNEERDKPFTDCDDWAARIILRMPEKNAIKLGIFIPSTAVIGDWELRIKTSVINKKRKLLYRNPMKFIVLFNPWSALDQVHYTDDKADLNEYILNPKGTTYFGNGNFPQAKPWEYGQFEKDILPICLALLRKAFGFKMSSAMADPLMVTRALSKIVNSQDDMGVLMGNWSGKYEGGCKPTSWTSSSTILRQHANDGAPVKFGQCWVFSHVLTAVCRCLGLPCRSVTNFASAHDTDGTGTIDKYIDDKSMTSDSIWNFHVWNEVWMLRPEIQDRDVNGWHVIDGTPQEMSDGVYQCGPCPVKAVLNGWIDIGWDTCFVFAEVNADEVHWVLQNNENIVSAVKKGKVGKRISTKPPNGQSHRGNLSFWNKDDPELRMDLTSCYKHKEGSEEERLAVKRAVRQAGRVQVYFDTAELVVAVDEAQQTMVGEDLEVTVLVKNISEEDKDVETTLSARSTTYFDDPDQEKVICKEEPRSMRIPKGGQEKLKIIVPSSIYTKECDDSMNVYIYAVAKDLKQNMPYSAQEVFSPGVPDIEVQCPFEADEKQVVTVNLVVTNPLDIPLTDCMLNMEGDLWQSEDDENLFESFFFHRYLYYRDLKPKETVTIPLKLYWENPQEGEDSEEEDSDGEDDEEAEETGPGQEEKYVTETFEFTCKEMYTMSGTCILKCCEHR